MSEPTTPPSRIGVFLVALRLGLTSFGGPIAHIGYFRREYVERRRWIDEAGFADLVALSQFLPGPASSQLGIAIGTRRAGVAGGIAAWLGFTMPSAVLMLAFALFAVRFDVADAGWVHGLQIAAVAIVAQAVIVMARAHAPDARRRAIALTALVAALLLITPLAQVAIIVGGAIAGQLLLPRSVVTSPAGSRTPIGRRVGFVALGTFAVLLVALPILRVVGGQPVAVLDAFFRSGALVFGGGHVVLPLLHANVVEPGWVTDQAFTAGYGAAQALPGPLFTFSAYLGAVSTVPPAGILGGLLALVAIFLPGFLLVVGAMPFWDALRSSARFRTALLGTNAAVVGILAGALYMPIWTSAVRSIGDVAIAATGLVLLMIGRVPPVVVVVLAAVAAQTRLV